MTPKCAECIHFTDCQDSGKPCDHFRDEKEYTTCPECGKQVTNSFPTCYICGARLEER